MSPVVSYYLYKYVYFYRYIVLFFWPAVTLFFLILYGISIKKYKISGQKTAMFGFACLFITMIFNLLHLDDAAGKAAEFVLILFAISFIQEFYHFLRYENK